MARPIGTHLRPRVSRAFAVARAEALAVQAPPQRALEERSQQDEQRGARRGAGGDERSIPLVGRHPCRQRSFRWRSWMGRLLEQFSTLRQCSLRREWREIAAAVVWQRPLKRGVDPPPVFFAMLRRWRVSI